ncbi:MAG: KEOPS complex kinase/ATPase Bud32 [Candidatus Norongarragalinales archaeon]
MRKQKQTIIGGGAEAIIYREGPRVIKHRPHKSYRHPQIDKEFRESRTRREARVLQKAKQIGLCVPRVLRMKESEGILEIEHVRGIKARDLLEDSKVSMKRKLAVCKEIGRGVALLHTHGIVHGDLTTSNFIVTRAGQDERVCFIDFGLSFHSDRIEDKAVDLHLFKRALESKHWRRADAFFAAAVEGYKENCAQAKEILARLSVVETRGRYKQKGSS